MADKEKLTKVQVFSDYSIKEHNDKETKILETTKYSEMANVYMREFVIKQDKAIIITWLKALGEKQLLDVYNWIKEVMEERNINKETNKMTTDKEILNSDGSRNWQANILLDNVKRLEAEYARLRQTLQEIKEIAETCMSKDTCYDCDYCDTCDIDDAEIPTYDVCNLILQKISEVTNESSLV